MIKFNWLKDYLPRGLYGRAALILVLPVVTLLLVVSVVFVQRHFEGVTEQLSRESARALNVAIRDPSLAEALDLKVTEIPSSEALGANFRRWYDFTGIVVIRTLQQRVNGVQRIELIDDALAVVYATRGTQTLQIQMSRGRLSASNPHQLLVNMLFFGILMTVIAFAYMRNQLRPIMRLAQAAEAFGKGRHYRYSPSGAIEVRAAGNAFLDMRNRIERQIEQRTMMLSGVSHDLRTPLTRLRLGLSLLEEEDRVPLEQDVEEMQRLIDAFLDFARGDADAGKSEKVDPHEFVRAIVDDFGRSGESVSIAVLEGQGEVILRPQAVRRAIENLINNAVRYGENCQISVMRGESSLRIRVEDDGPGIAPDQRQEAMRPFTRLDPARNQDKGSSVGLGLAIAADIARAHGGVLRLTESPDLGGLRADFVIAC